MAQPRKLIGSVQRAIDILELFEPNVTELGISDIARSLDLPKSTAAGLITTLEHNGYLDQHPETRKYRLGFKLAERAGVLLEQFDLRQIVAPVLEDLRDRCNESVNLAVRDGDNVVYIERMYGKNMLGMRSEIGKHEPIHSTALGKAILAALTKEDIQAFVRNHDFVPVTPRTITDPDEFLKVLQLVQQRGYAIDDQENELGGRCVAAAIFDLHSRPVAAISISVPIQRLPAEEIDTFGRLIWEAAQKISRKLGSSRQPSERVGNHSLPNHGNEGGNR